MTDLATRAGMPLPVYSRIESGGREPSWKSLLKIATALHVSLAEFDCCLR